MRIKSPVMLFHHIRLVIGNFITRKLCIGIADKPLSVNKHLYPTMRTAEYITDYNSGAITCDSRRAGKSSGISKAIAFLFLNRSIASAGKSEAFFGWS